MQYDNLAETKKLKRTRERRKEKTASVLLILSLKCLELQTNLSPKLRFSFWKELTVESARHLLIGNWFGVAF